MSLPDSDTFTGPITLEEVKQHIKCNKTFLCRLHQTMACVDTCSETSNESLQIIESHSAPNLRSVKKPNIIAIQKAVSTAMLEVPDELQLKIDKDAGTVDLTFSLPDKMTVPEAFSTPMLEVPDKINRNMVTVDSSVLPIYEIAVPEAGSDSLFDVPDILKNTLDSFHREPMMEKNVAELNITPLMSITTSDKVKKEGTANDIVNEKYKDLHFKTPSKDTNFLKVTPAKAELLKKADTPFKTPQKLYSNVVSPVGCYIKGSPVVALVKNVGPRKPIPGHSNIPKLIKSRPTTSNKENVILPQIAYRTAKETQVIDCPENRKLPQSAWAKQVSSSLRKAVVMKHSHRENSSVQQPLNQQEDSFCGLPMHQADLSICTKNNALNKLGK